MRLKRKISIYYVGAKTCNQLTKEKKKINCITVNYEILMQLFFSLKNILYVSLFAFKGTKRVSDRKYLRLYNNISTTHVLMFITENEFLYNI